MMYGTKSEPECMETFNIGLTRDEGAYCSSQKWQTGSKHKNFRKHGFQEAK